MNPWSLEKHNIDSNTHKDDYVFNDIRVLKRVPYSWLILAGLEFVLLLPGLIFIEEEDPEDATENTVFENTSAETTGIENTAPENKQQQLNTNGLPNEEELKNTASDNIVQEKKASNVSKPILGTSKGHIAEREVTIT